MNTYTEFPHVMLDIESIGVDPGNVITSIAAVHFDIETAATHSEFYINIDIQSCLDVGLTINGGTLQWWFAQTKEAREKLFDPEPVNLSLALHKFYQWYQGAVGSKSNIWGNSARFDCGLLEYAYKKCNKSTPWDWKTEKDVRTLIGFDLEIKTNEIFTGTPHNAIDDCKHQVKYLSKVYNKYFNK